MHIAIVVHTILAAAMAFDVSKDSPGNLMHIIRFTFYEVKRRVSKSIDNVCAQRNCWLESSNQRFVCRPTRIESTHSSHVHNLFLAVCGTNSLYLTVCATTTGLVGIGQFIIDDIAKGIEKSRQDRADKSVACSREVRKEHLIPVSGETKATSLPLAFPQTFQQHP